MIVIAARNRRSPHRSAEGGARANKLAKAAADLDKLTRTAGTRYHPTAEAVAARVQAIAARRRAALQRPARRRRRYGEFKGPLAVAPIFLELNRRITALITVICVALLIFCLVERQVRQALAPTAR